jgi:putative flippase GtrA
VSRAARFVWVGAGGFVVQAATLQGLVGLADLGYPLATALAVEAAILHNFLWHERWTWADRGGPQTGGHTAPEPRRHARRWARFLRFNGLTAVVSIGGNLALMALLVGVLHAPLLVGMALSVAALSVVNFACADRFVFRP